MGLDTLHKARRESCKQQLVSVFYLLRVLICDSSLETMWNFLPLEAGSPEVLLWSAEADFEPQTCVFRALSLSGAVTLTSGGVFPVCSHWGPTPLSVYALPVYFTSCALRSISVSPKCQRAASLSWAVMENIFHSDPWSFESFISIFCREHLSLSKVMMV